MQDYLEAVNEYIDYNKNSLSQTTLRSIQSQLRAHKKVLAPNLDNPEAVYSRLSENLSSYSLKTTFGRFTSFVSWLHARGRVSGPNLFIEFRNKNKLLFKNVYKREELTVTFDEAKSLIMTIPNETIKNHCLALLFSGMRISELSKFDGEGVVGKGMKYRKIYLPKDFVLKGDICEANIRYWLKRVGLKPHTLRKLFATKLSRTGLRPEEICEACGWSSFKTAFYYMQPDKSRLEDVIKEQVWATV